MKKKIFIEGMKCENCAKHVKEALKSLEGLISAEVSLSDKYVIIETNTEVSYETIKVAINTEKYDVVRVETL